MKKLLFLAVMSMMLFAVTGCLRGVDPVQPPDGMIFAEYKAPLDPSANNKEFGSKVGRATHKAYVFNLVSVGDMSLKSAAANGGIKTVKHVDYEYKNVLYFYQETTIVAYGD
ncbi:MAG: hypothetical protein A2X49_12065 [Lentisphaerae bacterium GWF2_52_8]|nr:MAG: hypothetical protein A2X49_12065 [Lentisphaerae bacterium GWF2_52_8]